MTNRSKLRLSRYSFPFSRNGKFLLYNSKTNSFFECSEDLYSFLKAEEIDIDELDADILKSITRAGILSTEEDDDNYVCQLEFYRNMATYNSSKLNITVAPTVRCNLRCPYCFELYKPSGEIDYDTADKIISFIKEHDRCDSYNLTWYGGEPLLALDKIEYMLDRLSKEVDMKRTHHGIVSNGTLFTKDAISLFKEFPLNSIQITLDGIEKHHNTKRFFANGNGTFNVIISNIVAIVENLPETNINVRVNVDKSNKEDYIEIINCFKCILPENNRVHVYPGILRKYGNCSLYDFFTNKDVWEFYKELRSAGYPVEIYPHWQGKGCSATSCNHYVIGPKGELYNCWEDVGDTDSVIGNIKDKKLSNPNLMYNYIIKGVAFASEECKKCGLLPLCSGGCPKRRLQNKSNNLSELCYVYSQHNNEALYDLLWNYYVERVENAEV